MSKLKLVTKKTTDGKTFYYRDFGSESHGRTSFRLWVHCKLVEKDDNGEPYLVLPCKGTLTQGKSLSTVILRPGNRNIYQVEVPCGYRGRGDFEILNDPNATSFAYYLYRSPLGSLGIGKGRLIESSVNPLKISWTRTGRLYGAPGKGTRYYYLDGKIEDFEETDECEIEDLAEVE